MACAGALRWSGALNFTAIGRTHAGAASSREDAHREPFLGCIRHVIIARDRFNGEGPARRPLPLRASTSLPQLNLARHHCIAGRRGSQPASVGSSWGNNQPSLSSVSPNPQTICVHPPACGTEQNAYIYALLTSASGQQPSWKWRGEEASNPHDCQKKRKASERVHVFPLEKGASWGRGLESPALLEMGRGEPE